MIKSLITEITSVLHKEYLFAAFLPTLLFLAAIFATFASVVGFLPMLQWASEQAALEKAILPVVAAVTVAVLAYVLTGLRSFLLELWSGEVSFYVFAPLLRIGEAFARANRQRLVDRAGGVTTWAGEPAWFRSESLGACWRLNGKQPAANDVKRATDLAESLHHAMGVTAVQSAIRKDFLPLVTAYDATQLSPAYATILRKLRTWAADDLHNRNEYLWKVDRRYGMAESIRATHLGNVIESYNAYSYQRYGIEPEIFWPHLQAFVNNEEMKKMVATTRTTLDFALAMTSYGALYSILCILVGPWIAKRPDIWFSCAAGGFLVAAIFYRVAIVAAQQFGDVFRACFDLFRFDLMGALRRKLPDTLNAEKVKWLQLSQLSVYGKAYDFELAHPNATSVFPEVSQ
jgi:hypothetical protein